MKKIIIVIIIILIVTSIALITILSLREKDGKQEYLTINGADQTQYSNKIEKVTDYRAYISARNCINKYLKKIYYAKHPELVENESDPESTEEIKAAIIDMLYKPYIEENNINANNLLNHVYDVDENYFIDILDMREILDTRIQTYYIYGEIGGNQKIYLVLYVDDYNAVFAIQPIDEQYNNIDEINIKKEINEIEPTYNNKTIYSEINDQTICTNYLMNYKSNLLNNSEQAYNLLEESYKNARFGNLENFQEYLNDSKEIIDKITLKAYKVNQYDDYTEYVCQDIYENYYIFQLKSVFDYTVKLDLYTLSEEFEKNYSEANNERKAALNVEKFFEMINARDYKNAFESLDKTFRNENFQTYENFKEYVKTNFYSKNSVRYSTNKIIGDLYTFDMIIKDKNDENSEEINKTFIVQLLEGTEYVLSFNIE